MLLKKKRKKRPLRREQAERTPPRYDPSIVFARKYCIYYDAKQKNYIYLTHFVKN